MKKWIFFLACGLLVALPVAAQPKMVFSTINGLPITALGERILQEAYQKQGISITLESYPGERSLVMANAGKVDGELARIKGIEKEYPNLVMVPVPIAELTLAAFSNQSLTINNFNDLKKYRIGFVGGTKVLNQLTANFPHVLRVNKVDQLFDMLLLGRIDVVIDMREDGLIILQADKFKEIKMVAPSLYQYSVYHYLNKKHAALVPRITKELQDMTDQGIIKKRADEFMAELKQQHAQ